MTHQLCVLAMNCCHVMWLRYRRDTMVVDHVQQYVTKTHSGMVETSCVSNTILQSTV